MTIETQSLRFVNADQVNTPLGGLAGTVAVSPTGDRIGHVDGIVIDPAERRAPYLVVAARRRLRMHRYLMPLAHNRIDIERHVLEVDFESDDLSKLPEMPSRGIPTLSDEDVITALFS